MSRFAQMAEERKAKINAYAAETGVTQRRYDLSGTDLLLLDLPDAAPVPPERLRCYADQHKVRVAPHATLGGSCLFIASDSVRAGMAVGIVGTRDNEERFASFVNHYMPYDHLLDDTVVGVDLTASHNIVMNYGGLDVLALRAATLGDLCLSLAGLYGGTWQDANSMTW